MFIGSENQFRNLYVVNRVDNADFTADGDVKVVKDADNKTFHFEYKDVNNVVHSDVIDIDKIMSITSTKSTKMQRVLKTKTVKPNGNLISGQDYIVHIQVQNYIGLGDDLIHTKFGAVHATKGMTVSKWCLYMALSMAKNFSREATKLFKFVVSSGAASAVKTKEITPDMTYADMDAEDGTNANTYTEVVIYEVEQPWRRGISPVEPVNFTVIPSTVLEDGEYKACAVVDDLGYTKGKPNTDATPKGATLGNGKAIADMEWFYHGNRGDALRGWAYPNDFEFIPMVKENLSYDVVDIHYYWINTGVENGRSERTITFVMSNVTSSALLTSFTKKLEEVTGTGSVVATQSVEIGVPVVDEPTDSKK